MPQATSNPRHQVAQLWNAATSKTQYPCCTELVHLFVGSSETSNRHGVIICETVLHCKIPDYQIWSVSKKILVGPTWRRCLRRLPSCDMSASRIQEGRTCGPRPPGFTLHHGFPKCHEGCTDFSLCHVCVLLNIYCLGLRCKG